MEKVSRFRAGLRGFCFGFRLFFGLKQFMKVHDHIFGHCIVHIRLAYTAPSLFCFRIGWENPNDINFAEIGKFERLRVFNLTTKDKMKELFVSHELCPYRFGQNRNI